MNSVLIQEVSHCTDRREKYQANTSQQPNLCCGLKELIIHYTLLQNLSVFRWCCYDHFKYCYGHFSCPFLAGALCCGPTVLKFCNWYSFFKPCTRILFLYIYIATQSTIYLLYQYSNLYLMWLVPCSQHTLPTSTPLQFSALQLAGLFLISAESGNEPWYQVLMIRS